MKALILLASTILIATTASAQHQTQKFRVNTLDGTRVGIIDRTNWDTLLPAKYDDVDAYTGNGYFTVTLNDKMGVVDTNNRVIIPIIHTFCSTIQEGRALIGNGNKLAVADKSGKLLTGYIFETASLFNSGVSRIKMNGLFGYVNTAGKIIIPCKYLDASDPANGIVRVKTNKREELGTYDVKQGRKVQQVNVGYNETYSIIYNLQGQKIYQGQGNEEIMVWNGNLVATKYTNDDNYISQLMDMKGRVLYPYSNNYRMTPGDHWIIISQGNKHGIIGYDGKELLKPNFRQIESTIIDGTKYSKVYFSDGTSFYIDKNAKCVEIDGSKCPTE